MAALAVAGTLAWLLGTYQKEASICVLPLLGGVALAGRSWLGGWKQLSSARTWSLGALGAVVAVPLLHVAIETIRIVQRGDLVYEAEASGGGVVSGVQLLWEWTHEAVPENARFLAYGAVALTIVVAIVRRRLDPIAVGALASGALTFVYAGQAGVVATRYYIPAVALFAVAFSLSLARLPAPLVAAGGLAVFFSFMPPPGTRDDVQLWTSEELRNGALVREAAELESSGCVVAAAGLNAEESVALPVVIGMTSTDRARTCPPGETFLVVGPGTKGKALMAACRPGGTDAVDGGSGGDGVSLCRPPRRPGAGADRRPQPARSHCPRLVRPVVGQLADRLAVGVRKPVRAGHDVEGAPLHLVEDVRDVLADDA